MKKKLSALLLTPIALLLVACGQVDYSLDIYFTPSNEPSATEPSVNVVSKLDADAANINSLIDAGRSDVEIMTFYSRLANLGLNPDEATPNETGTSLSPDGGLSVEWSIEKYPLEATERSDLNITHMGNSIYQVAFDTTTKITAIANYLGKESKDLTAEDFAKFNVNLRVHAGDNTTVWTNEDLYEATIGENKVLTTIVNASPIVQENGGNNGKDSDLLSTIADIFNQYSLYIYAGGGGIAVFLLILLFLSRRGKSEKKEKTTKVREPKAEKKKVAKEKVVKERPVKKESALAQQTTTQTSTAENTYKPPIDPSSLITFTVEEAKDPNKG